MNQRKIPSLFSPRFGATFALGATLFLAACSGSGLKTEGSYENKEKDDLYKNGSLMSDEGGVALLGGGESKKNTDGGGIGVNGFLWRATLDTIAFMPITAADPFGGVITTDWYSAPATPDERVKMNVFILDRDLRADGVRVAVFRQTRGADNSWTDTAVAPSTASSLEETILTRARQMRLAQKDQQ